MKYWWATLAAAAAAITCAQTAQADVIFSDNFNSYAYQLNWVPPANWTVTSGSVDLIGETTPFDFYPGNGRYVDLDGSTGAAGTLRTIMNFAPGTYAVSFDLGGNARNDGAEDDGNLTGKRLNRYYARFECGARSLHIHIHDHRRNFELCRSFRR